MRVWVFVCVHARACAPVAQNFYAAMHTPCYMQLPLNTPGPVSHLHMPSHAHATTAPPPPPPTASVRTAAGGGGQASACEVTRQRGQQSSNAAAFVTCPAQTCNTMHQPPSATHLLPAHQNRWQLPPPPGPDPRPPFQHTPTPLLPCPKLQPPPCPRPQPTIRKSHHVADAARAHRRAGA